MTSTESMMANYSQALLEDLNCNAVILNESESEIDEIVSTEVNEIISRVVSTVDSDDTNMDNLILDYSRMTINESF